MRDRAPIAVVVLGAIALVGVVTWWFPRDADPVAAVVPVLESGSPPAGVAEDRSTLQALTPASRAPLPALEDGDHGLSAEGLWTHFSDPRNSGLEPRLFASLSKLGVAIVRADATGEGRVRWPDYWVTDARAKPCCREITVHSAGAAKDPVARELARVTVAWSAEGLGATGQTRISTVVLRRSNTGWQPVRD